MPSRGNGNNNTNQDGRSLAAVPVVDDRPGSSKTDGAVLRPSVKESQQAIGKTQSTIKKKAISNVMREKMLRKRLFTRLLLFVCFVSVFALGFFLRGFEPLMERLDPALAADNSLKQATTAKASTYNSVSARVAEVERILSTSSLDAYDVDKVSNAVLQSFAYVIDDNYLRYFNEERYQLYVKENAASDYSGIGVLFAEYEGKTYAADVFQNSVADLAGVHQGDVVHAVNGDASQKWTPTEVINAIAASAGDQIAITWQRASSLESEGDITFNTTLTCRQYLEKNVETSLEENNVGLISVSQLSQNSSSLVSTSVTALQNRGATSFVLDLRDCSGGYLSQAVNIASLFVKSGTLVQIKTKDGITNKIASGSTVTELPLVVLVDEDTAGAAEVLAAALRDNSRADLVGTKTLGKGSVQSVQSLTFGGAIRYTSAYYLSPLGHDIEGQGVSPDTTIADAADQLSVALQVAASRADSR